MTKAFKLLEQYFYFFLSEKESDQITKTMIQNEIFHKTFNRSAT